MSKRHQVVLFTLLIILLLALFTLMNVVLVRNLISIYYASATARILRVYNLVNKFSTPSKGTTQTGGGAMMYGNNGKFVELKDVNGSGESGTALLREVDGQISVIITLTGAPTGVAQPAHIHVGSCPNPGDVKYPLTSLVNGKSVTTVNTTFAQLTQQLPLAINVHKSQTDIKTYVSCGNLTAK